MEYRTKVTTTSALLGVLCLTGVLGWVFSQQSVVDRQSKETLLTGFKSSDVQSLELGNGIKVTKDSHWNLTVQGKSYPASPDRIETYLKTLSTVVRDRLVTTGNDVKSFGLDQGFKTLKLSGAGGTVLADLQVGGANDLGDKVYVRFAGQKEVWETDRGFARTLDLDFNTWADHSLFPGKKAEDLTRIAFDSRIETADKTVYVPFDLEKSGKRGKTTWVNRINKVAVDTMGSWANLVPAFRFSSFAGPTDPPAIGASLGTLTAYWSDGSQIVVKIGQLDGQKGYRASEGTRDFWINDWALGQILYT